MTGRAPRRYRRRDPMRIAGRVGIAALVVAAAIFYISYNALTGLPGQSRYTVWINVPNASHLNKSDEVRIGGLRVGQVAKVGAVVRPGRHPYAHIKLQLDKDASPLTTSSRVSVQTASVLGASYVDIKPADGGTRIADGGQLALSQAGDTTQLTDLLDVFDRSTARNIQAFLRESSAGFAGRGPALNDTIASFAALLGPFGRVARLLAEPGTGLAGFIDAADRASAAFAPSAQQLRSLVAGGATTFSALAAAGASLAAATERAPGAESAATAALTHAQPGLNATARVFTQLRPAARELPGALRAANGALTAGMPALRRLPPFAKALQSALAEVRVLASKHSTDGAVRKTTELFATDAPLFDALNQMQTTCNSLGIWATGFSSVFGDVGTAEGPALAQIEVTTLGANGETVQSAKPATDLSNNQYAHNNNQECESGNEPWTGRQQRTNPPGLQPKKTLVTAPPTGVLDLARGAGLIGPEPR